MSENASVGHAQISSEQNTGLLTAVYVTELFYDEALLPHKTALLQLENYLIVVYVTSRTIRVGSAGQKTI